MKLLLSRFINDPHREYVSIINDHQQLRVEHSHDYFELFVVNHGGATHAINGQHLNLSKGTLMLVRPDDVHSYRQMSADFEIINVLIPTQTMQEIFDYLGESFKPDRILGPKIPLDVRLSLDDLESVVTSLEKLVVAKHAQGVNSDALFRFTMLNLIFTRFPIAEEHGMPDMPTWLRGLCLEMMKKSNFTKGLPALYAQANKSKEHLARIFRRYLKKTPTEFINDLRLEYTARMIVSTEGKIVDICGEAGFESVSHYYHLFQKKYGMSPLEFRHTAAESDPYFSIVGDSVLETGIPTGIPLLSKKA